MRNYAKNSPKAGARIVALALMADGAIDRSEVLLLERQDVAAGLGLDKEQFDAIYYDCCTDMLGSGQRNVTSRLELDKPRIKALLGEISDPGLQKTILRIMIDIVHADHRLAPGEASLIAQALERWDMDLRAITEASVPRYCLSSRARHEGSAVSSSGRSHHAATG